MFGLLGFLAALVAIFVGYRLGPFIFDGFVSRRYEELFRAADIWEIDRRFQRVLLEHSTGN